jgi:hypothetical protein
VPRCDLCGQSVQGASELADLWRRLVLKVGCELAEPCQVSVGIPAQVDVMDAFFGDPTGAGLQLGSPATSKPLVALFAILGHAATKAAQPNAQLVTGYDGRFSRSLRRSNEPLKSPGRPWRHGVRKPEGCLRQLRSTTHGLIGAIRQDTAQWSAGTRASSARFRWWQQSTPTGTLA